MSFATEVFRWKWPFRMCLERSRGWISDDGWLGALLFELRAEFGWHRAVIPTTASVVQTIARLASIPSDQAPVVKRSTIRPGRCDSKDRSPPFF